MFYFFSGFFRKSLNFSESALFHQEMETNFEIEIGFYIVNVMIFIKKYLSYFFRISFDELSPLCWYLIFSRTYLFLCHMWCVMCDVWCVLFRTWFLVRSWIYESRGEDHKYPMSVISDLFNEISKLIPGGSRMNRKYWKAS